MTAYVVMTRNGRNLRYMGAVASAEGQPDKGINVGPKATSLASPRAAAMMF
jgi:hypothetical protein